MDEKGCPDPGVGLHANGAVVGGYHLLHQRQAGPAAGALRGGAALKELAPQIGRDPGTCVLHAEQKPIGLLPDTDGDLLGTAQRLIETLDGVFDQISQNGHR